jgi:predicted NAD/FAD-dependent oxidoreductase
MQSRQKVAIIGAGIAGITCARFLQDAGIEVVIYEKSRGIGGRLATRRTAKDLSFDHGAPYFTARSTGFRKFLDASGGGAILSWRPRNAGTGEQGGDWLVSAPGMNSFLRQAAGDLDVRFGATVAGIEASRDGWRLMLGAASDVGSFDRVIITSPAEQAMALTPFSPRLQASLSSIRMSPCWALMLSLMGRSEVVSDVLHHPSSDIACLARNSVKPGRSGAPETWVAHAGPDWSRQNLELEKEAACLRLIEAALPLLGLRPANIAYADAHRWRYANVEQPAGEAFLSDETGCVLVCGDGCLGPGVEAAFRSASALAEFLAPQLACQP